jgi:hypothetical protein
MAIQRENKIHIMPTTETWQHQYIVTNGIRMHYVTQGAGPLVVLLHGFPEFWYSWRYQIPFLAEHGYTVVALICVAIMTLISRAKGTISLHFFVISRGWLMVLVNRKRLL